MSLPQLLIPDACQYVLQSTDRARYIHPFLPGAEVPGAPVSDLLTTQKSSVIPHWPQILQQTFNGQGLSMLMLVDADGCTVPFFVGPQTAFYGVVG